MKTDFSIFYSWQSDLPQKYNHYYIKECIDKAIKLIKSELNVNIKIETDTRNSSGLETIEKTILTKIGACDLFIADVTPIRTIEVENTKVKGIPNPNVMFELGYAVRALGWSRILMINNDKYGGKEIAPFDINHHNIIGYYFTDNSDKKCCGQNLYQILKEKISHYEELVEEFRQSDEIGLDIKLFYETETIVRECELLDSIKTVQNNLAYYRRHSKIWDSLIYRYHDNPSNKYLDEELNNSYSNFIEKLEEMWSEAAISFREIEFPSREDDDRFFKIQNSYEIFDNPDEASADEKNNITKFFKLGKDALTAYEEYRKNVQRKLKI